MEKRTLEAAYKFYCDKTLEDAHSAAADTMATYEVLKAQLAKYPDLENNIPFWPISVRIASLPILQASLVTTRMARRYLILESIRVFWLKKYWKRARIFWMVAQCRFPTVY